MVLWASAASAQGIAGKWAIDMEKTQASNPAMQGGGGGGGGGGGRQGGGFGGGGAMTITLSATEMGITRAGQNGDMTTTYKLDGSEQTITMGRGEAKAKAKMDGNKVVVETTRAGRDGASVTSKAVYSVEGDYLVVETTQPGRDGAAMTSKRYYKKAA
jgi:hypothetical protein